MSPQDAMQKAQEYERRADMGARLSHIPGVPQLFGDPVEN